MEERAKRKLSAILSADVVGYSRLMGEDELSTVRTLEAYREIISEIIQNYSGRVVDSPGDNVLAEFASVVDAVESAVEIQKDLEARNAELPKNRRMVFRIGINLGDVIEEGERIYGDGINVAARIEGLAEGGGICISRTAFDQVKNKLNLGYENIGKHSVKNIAEPVRVYRVRMEPEAAGKVIGEEKLKPRQWRWAAIGAVTVFILMVAALAIWNFYFRSAFEPASVEKMALPLPDKPSIAVLPFKNLSGDSEQEFLADGITESIIGAISRVSGLFVIASNSVFTYKGKAVKIQTVSEELGVQNVLEGTVQRMGNRLRIHAQLIDAITGRHLWSEKYDREMKDLFSVQDNISKEVLTALRVKIVEGEQARVWAKGTNNIDAYLKFLQAYDIFKSFTKEKMILTRQICEEAIALDPNYAAPYSLLGTAHLIDLWFHWGESPSASIEESEAALKKAIELNPFLDFAYANLGHLYLMQKRYDEAIAAGEKSIELNPNGDYNMILLGITLTDVRRYEESIPLVKEGQRRNPYCPAWYIHNLGVAYLMLGRWNEAIAELKRALRRNPDHMPALLFMAVVYGMTDRLDEGRTAAAEMLKVDPKFSIEKMASWPSLDAEVWRDALRKVGIPEKSPLPLPDKPSIAVLPFKNLSGDSDQEFLADGITESIIGTISRISALFVISSNSAFTYKGKAVKVQTVSKELGVRNILEGTVQRVGNRLRVNAQLIDAITGGHLWSEKYDREMKDIFSVQDSISKQVLTALRVKLVEGEQARVWARGTNNIEAYLKFLQAYEFFRSFTKENMILVRQICEEGITLDSNYDALYSLIGGTHLIDLWFHWGESSRASIEKSVAALKKAVALNPLSDYAWANLGHLNLMQKRFDESVAAGEKSIELNPNGDYNMILLGITFNYVRRYEEAIRLFKEGQRRNPYCPAWYIHNMGNSYTMLGRYDEAIAEFQRALYRNPDHFPALVCMAGVYGAAGRIEEARAVTERILKLDPGYCVEKQWLPFKFESDAEALRDNLRKAGIPEKPPPK